MPDQKVFLLNTAFATFVEIITRCNLPQQLDYQILAFDIYCGMWLLRSEMYSIAQVWSELLKDDLSEESLVEPTLQSLKALIEQTRILEGGNERIEQILHALLSTCIINVDDMRYQQLSPLISCIDSCLGVGKGYPVSEKSKIISWLLFSFWPLPITSKLV